MNVISNYLMAVVLILGLCMSRNGQFECRGTSFKIAYPKAEEGTTTIESYPEGEFTFVTYSDSSLLMIHCGSMNKLPFFKGENFVLQDSSRIGKRLTRSGYKLGSKLFWREDYFSNKKILIGYSNVKKENLEAFDQSLNEISFEANSKE